MKLNLDIVDSYFNFESILEQLKKENILKNIRKLDIMYNKQDLSVDVDYLKPYEMILQYFNKSKVNRLVSKKLFDLKVNV